ncbi:MAG TPA: hypothetical protein VIX89_10550 [Bryobacteraceae bacterium]
MRGPNPRVYYKLSAPVHAVKLEPHPGSSLRDPTGVLIMIPAGVTIELESASPPASGLVDVLWDGHAYSVFFGDLQEKAQIAADGN